MGWFFGFKLHITVNDQGKILSFCITPGNIDDRKPLDKLTSELTGKLFGDRGYISKKWFEKLMKQGLQLITSVKSNMKNKLQPMIQIVITQALYYRNHQCPTKKYFTNRTFLASFFSKLYGEYYRRTICLFSSEKEAFY